jgi:hypothetical protein
MVSLQQAVSLVIVDVSGHAVVRQELWSSGGRATFIWDRRDSGGKRLGSGMYFILAKNELGRVLSQKAVLVR